MQEVNLSLQQKANLIVSLDEDSVIAKLTGGEKRKRRDRKSVV